MHMHMHMVLWRAEFVVKNSAGGYILEISWSADIPVRPRRIGIVSILPLGRFGLILYTVCMIQIDLSENGGERCCQWGLSGLSKTWESGKITDSHASGDAVCSSLDTCQSRPWNSGAADKPVPPRCANTEYLIMNEMVRWIWNGRYVYSILNLCISAGFPCQCSCTSTDSMPLSLAPIFEYTYAICDLLHWIIDRGMRLSLDWNTMRARNR